MMCKGILPRFQEPLQLEVLAGRADNPRWPLTMFHRRQMCRCEKCLNGQIDGGRLILTTMMLLTNTVYTKKSPGCENRLDSRSIELPYWYRKYGSSKMANFGFVIKKAVKMRQTCGTIFIVKTARVAKTYWLKEMIPPYPRADTVTARAVMVL